MKVNDDLILSLSSKNKTESDLENMMKSYEIQHYSIPVGIVTYVHLLFLNVKQKTIRNILDRNSKKVFSKTESVIPW